MGRYHFVFLIIGVPALLWCASWTVSAAEESAAQPSFGATGGMVIAGAPNLVLNPGFESDAGGAVVGTDKDQDWKFSAKGDGAPDDWSAAADTHAVVDAEVAHSGRNSVRLSSPGGILASTSAVIGGETVKAILPAGAPIVLSAWSRADNVPVGSTYRLECKMGEKTYTLEFTPGTHDWENRRLVVMPEVELGIPQVTITFQAPETSSARVWFDDISMAQARPFPNLAVNPGFERGRAGRLPRGWGELPEDHLPYWGGYYWPAVQDTLMSHRGQASMRCDAAAGQTGGAVQTISLQQEEPRPIIVGAYCRAENLIADNFCWLAADVWYDNGKRELETARVFLGKATHDWDYRTFTIVPKRPVDHIVVKVENKSSLRTATVWVDDLYVAEVGSSAEELRARGLTLPLEAECPPLVTEGGLSGSRVQIGDNVAALSHDEENLYIALSSSADRAEVMLAPFGIPGYDDIEYISFYRFAISRDGTFSLETAIDQDGYVFYSAADISPFKWEAKVEPPTSADGNHWTAEMRIPFAALGKNPPSAGEEWLANFAFLSPKPDSSEAASSIASWSGDYDNFRSFGTLRFPGPRELELSDIRLGEGLPEGLDMSQSWITRSEVGWGESIFRASLANCSETPRTFTVEIKPTAGTGSVVTASLEAGHSWELGLPYRITSTARQGLELTLKDANSGTLLSRTAFPVNVPEPVQLHLDQFYYYPEETNALLQIACPYLPADKPATLKVRLLAESTGATFLETECAPAPLVTSGIDLSQLPISSEPVKEYRLQVDLVQDGKAVATASTSFGRLQRPKFAPQPPVEKVEVSPDGVLLVNGERFFPIVASLGNLKAYPRASEMGFNSEKDNIYGVEEGKARIEDAWKRNVYFVVSDFQSNPQDREALTVYSRNHPGVLMHVGSEVTYGSYFQEEGRQYLQKHEELDPVHPTFWEYEGGSGTWYARALGSPSLGRVIHHGGLVTDGPLGRIVPRVFALERAAATHPEEITVVAVPFRNNRSDFLVPGDWRQSMRSFSSQPFEELRAGVYLAVIQGARGLYYYAWAPDNQIDEARGLALELRLLSPVFLSPAIPGTVSLLPASNHIDVMQREYEGKTYLITCNRSEEPQQVEFRLPKITSNTPILRRFEPAQPIERSKDGGGFKDTFEGYEVHIYVIGQQQ